MVLIPPSWFLTNLAVFVVRSTRSGPDWLQHDLAAQKFCSDTVVISYRAE